MPSAGSNACYRKVVAGSAPPTTAIRFEAQATAEIDDHEAAGLCRRRATNDGGYYADQNADDAEGVLYGFLLCVTALLKNRVDIIGADFHRPRD